ACPRRLLRRSDQALAKHRYGKTTVPPLGPWLDTLPSHLARERHRELDAGQSDYCARLDDDTAAGRAVVDVQVRRRLRNPAAPNHRSITVLRLELRDRRLIARGVRIDR